MNYVKKASQKTGALSRKSSYPNNSEKRIIFKSMIKFQFNHCPQVWIFCSVT